MRSVVVAGVVANKHRQGGAVWTRLNWVLGLKRLGLDVHLVEQVASCACVDDDGRPAPFADSANLRSFTRVADRFGLTGRATLICEDGDESVGLSRAELRDVARDADALVNIGGHLTVQPLMDAFRRKAYVDLDPGYVQMWHAGGWSDRHLRDHDVHFSVGENLGRAGCTIPTGGIRWRPVRQPVVLDEWPLIPARDEPLRFTTVASWRGPYGPVHHGGRVYGSKVHEFRRFVELPGKVPAHFELALDIHPDETADLDLLSDHGWRLVRPHEVAGSPETFRDYVQGSGAEFSVAQGVYVHTGSGWFSDRTVRYLASGRPALVQDTGFSRNYPVGEGLLAFGTFDEAVVGAERIAADHARHCAAARALAETYFDSDNVLPQVLDQIQRPG